MLWHSYYDESWNHPCQQVFIHGTDKSFRSQKYHKNTLCSIVTCITNFSYDERDSCCYNHLSPLEVEIFLSWPSWNYIMWNCTCWEVIHLNRQDMIAFKIAHEYSVHQTFWPCWSHRPFFMAVQTTNPLCLGFLHALNTISWKYFWSKGLRNHFIKFISQSKSDVLWKCNTGTFFQRLYLPCLPAWMTKMTWLTDQALKCCKHLIKGDYSIISRVSWLIRMPYSYFHLWKLHL